MCPAHDALCPILRHAQRQNRIGLCVAAPVGRRAVGHHWRRRDVVVRGRVADRPGRSWQRARRGLAALHPRHARFCRRSCRHRPTGGSLWRHRPPRCRHAPALACLYRLGVCRQHLATGDRARGHRLRQLGHLRTADRRYFTLVCAPARLGGVDLCNRQLFRRDAVAANCEPIRRQRRLATDPSRHRSVLLTMLPLITVLKPRITLSPALAAQAVSHSARHSLGLSAGVLQVLLLIAGLACCVAMSMPQVHIVAYCGDLGFGLARGAEMLSIMLGFGIASRIGSGFVADRIGGLATMLLGSVLQTFALCLYLWFDGLTSLYVISAFFGLVQGGIIPMYAVIVRDFFPPHEAGTRVGLAVMATIVGMALGGWLSGAIFDLTGSYTQAFANGIAWNLLNVGIVAFLMLRRAGRQQLAAA